MTDLILNPTSTAQWLALVSESETVTGCHLDEDSESYLVFLLMRHTGKDQLTSQIVGRDFLRGLNLPSHSRQQQLQDVGDHCLLFSGLFPQQAERRRVSLSYFVDLGRTAYLEIAEGCQLARSGLKDMFTHLSHDFVALMDVLQGIRTIGGQSCLRPIEAYDLWNDTGSKQAYEALTRLGGNATTGVYTGLTTRDRIH
ncbi:MAG: hypothetical protein GC138_10050 [Gammaproteobacteria bacterium]|nr:hypothetical protein [Gammaproteobacteria bacterium]